MRWGGVREMHIGEISDGQWGIERKLWKSARWKYSMWKNSRETGFKRPYYECPQSEENGNRA
jgi:hypothetical protein